jgi:5-bromo-4-chloroindolyl phosphate hydrolysis protein
MDVKKLETLLYFMTKKASNDSFVDFLENIGLTWEDYVEIREHFKETYGIQTYL